MTRLYRRSRPFRILCYLLLLPLWQLVEFISDDSLYRYVTPTGNAIFLALLLFFAVGAWWYAEDRDRRRAAQAAQGNGASSNGGHAH